MLLNYNHNEDRNGDVYVLRNLWICAFYRMAFILGIPRLCSAFYGICKSTDCAEHNYMHILQSWFEVLLLQ